MKFKNWAFLFLITTLFNCNKVEKNVNSIKSEKFGNVIIDSKISKNSIYKELNQQKEIFNSGEDIDSTIKKSSSVNYFWDLKNKKQNKRNNCRAYFFRSDTLWINIGIGNSFGGSGFIIKYKNKKFYTQPYHSTDIVEHNIIEPRRKIIYQTLVLDKSEYKLGDSIYGKIEFKLIETKQNGDIKEHFGKGNFRTIVKEI